MNTSTVKPGKRRWLLWCALLGVAGWLALFGDKSPGNSVAAASGPARTPAAPARAAALARPSDSNAAATMRPFMEALTSREQLIAAAPHAPASGADASLTGQRDLFSARSWVPPPPPPPPAPAPVAPPLPFAFLGKKLEGQAWEVYLTRGEQTFIVREGQTVENVWRIDKVAPPSMTVTYLPLDQVQTLTIGDTR
jgi:hypothetical protein